MNRSRHSSPDPAQLPLLGFVEFVAVGGGMYQAVHKPPVRLVSLKVAAKATGYSRATIYRLFKTGFIEGDHSSPGKIMIDLTSLEAHRLAANSDPDFWTEARKKQFRGR